MIKKMFVLLLTFVLICSMMAGCEGNKNSKNEIKDVTVTAEKEQNESMDKQTVDSSIDEVSFDDEEAEVTNTDTKNESNESVSSTNKNTNTNGSTNANTSNNTGVNTEIEENEEPTQIVERTDDDLPPETAPEETEPVVDDSYFEDSEEHEDSYMTDLG